MITCKEDLYGTYVLYSDNKVMKEYIKLLEYYGFKNFTHDESHYGIEVHKVGSGWDASSIPHKEEFDEGSKRLTLGDFRETLPSKHKFVGVKYKGNYTKVFSLLENGVELFDPDNKLLNVVSLAECIDSGKSIFKKETIDWKEECIKLLEQPLTESPSETEILGSTDLHYLLDVYPENFVGMVEGLHNVLDNYYDGGK